MRFLEFLSNTLPSGAKAQESDSERSILKGHAEQNETYQATNPGSQKPSRRLDKEAIGDPWN